MIGRNRTFDRVPSIFLFFVFLRDRRFLLKNIRFGGWLLAGLIALAFSGCAEETTSDGYYHGLVGFTDDSLVVYSVQLTESTCKENVLGDECSDHDRGTAIAVNNFYTQDSIWRSDYETTFDVYDMVDDSTIVAFSGANSAFYKWTLNGSMEKMGTFSWTGCDMRNNVGSIRPWKDGQWRLSRADSYSDSCSFALVNVENREITGYYEPDEYQQKCNDAWFLDGKTYCIGTVEKDTVISYNVRYLVGTFIRDNELNADTLWFENNYGFDYNGSPSISFRNDYILLYFNDFRLLKLDYKQTKFDLSYPIVWLDGLYWRGN